jgi:hypothetical protein
MHLIPVCRLSAERIREELFTGGFRPMKGHDFDGFADAELGSLIADEIKVGRYVYTVIFTPSLGNVQIFSFDGGESFAWEMDLQTGEAIEL